MQRTKYALSFRERLGDGFDDGALLLASRARGETGALVFVRDGAKESSLGRVTFGVILVDVDARLRRVAAHLRVHRRLP